VATPIAAGIAAGLLEFANYRCTLSPKEEYTVQETGNAGDISIHVPEGDGYDFVHPTIL
jgi:hypothetical protein